MLISDLVAKLQAVQALHGDVPVIHEIVLQTSPDKVVRIKRHTKDVGFYDDHCLLQED